MQYHRHTWSQIVTRLARFFGESGLHSIRQQGTKLKPGREKTILWILGPTVTLGCATKAELICEMKALLIEDNLVLATITSRSLQALSFRHVDVAHNGEEALRFLARQKYNVILVDWMLPNTNGLEIVKAIRASKDHQNTAIIMTTGKNERRDIIKALQSGVNSYLVKPISAQVLAAA